MSRVLTSDQLIASIKRRAMIPSNQKTFTNDDFLELLNEELDTSILPYLIEQHQEHLVDYIDIPVEDGRLVGNTRRYTIPYRAIGNKLRDVAFVGTDQQIYELSRIELDDQADYQNSFAYTTRDVFYLQSDEVVIPSEFPQDRGFIRMFYYLRPNKLVLTERTAKVTGIDQTNKIVTVDSFPDVFFTASKLDLIGAKTPNKTLAYDVSIVSFDSNTKKITLSNLPENLAVGDYVSLAEETCVPQIPTEMHPILAQAAAIYCLEALNDESAKMNAMVKLKAMKDGVMNLIENRVEGAPQKFNNRHSPLQDSVSRNRIRRKL